MSMAHTQTGSSTCSLVCAFVTNSRPTRMRGRRNALVSSTTGTPIRWQAFWATTAKYWIY